MNKDYSEYSLEELYEIKENVNRDLYPDRYIAVKEQIEIRESSGALSKEDAVFIEESKGFDSEKGCQNIIMYGVYAGAFILATNILNIFVAASGSIDSMIDIVLEMVIILVSMFYIYKKSRVASTFLFSYFAFSVTYNWVVSGKIGGFLVIPFVLLALFASMLGTFHWHNKYVKHKT